MKTAIWIVVVIVVLGGLYWWWSSSQSSSSTMPTSDQTQDVGTMPPGSTMGASSTDDMGGMQ